MTDTDPGADAERMADEIMQRAHERVRRQGRVITIFPASELPSLLAMLWWVLSVFWPGTNNYASYLLRTSFGADGFYAFMAVLTLLAAAKVAAVFGFYRRGRAATFVGGVAWWVFIGTLLLPSNHLLAAPAFGLAFGEFLANVAWES